MQNVNTNATSSYVSGELMTRNIRKSNVKNNLNMFSNYYKSEESNVRNNSGLGTFVNNSYLQNKLLNSNTEANQTNNSTATTINRNVDSDYVASRDGLGEMAIRYLPFTSEDGGKSSVGGSVSYAKDFDPENPVMVVRGEDEDGYYEAIVDIKKIDPKNCTAIEYKALNAYFKGESDAPFLPFNFASDSPLDSSNPNATFNLVEGHKLAKQMNMYASQGINYNFNDALKMFQSLWGEKFKM